MFPPNGLWVTYLDVLTGPDVTEVVAEREDGSQFWFDFSTQGVAARAGLDVEWFRAQVRQDPSLWPEEVSLQMVAITQEALFMIGEGEHGPNPY